MGTETGSYDVSGDAPNVDSSVEVPPSIEDEPTRRLYCAISSLPADTRIISYPNTNAFGTDGEPFVPAEALACLERIRSVQPTEPGNGVRVFWVEPGTPVDNKFLTLSSLISEPSEDDPEDRDSFQKSWQKLKENSNE